MNNLLNVNSVASVLVKQETYGYVKELVVGESPTNVNCLASVFVWIHTRVKTRKCTQNNEVLLKRFECD